MSIIVRPKDVLETRAHPWLCLTLLVTVKLKFIFATNIWSSNSVFAIHSNCAVYSLQKMHAWINKSAFPKTFLSLGRSWLPDRRQVSSSISRFRWFLFSERYSQSGKFIFWKLFWQNITTFTVRWQYQSKAKTS